MIILGVVLLLLDWLLAPILPLPYPIWELVHVAGVILLVVGFIFLILGFFGYAPGPGIGRPVNGRRFYW